MNLHGIASAAIAAVNPMQPVTVRVSLGSTTGADGARVPYYGPPITVSAQVQSLSNPDLRHADALNLQGELVKIYLNGQIDGLVRPDNKGGDLVTLGDGRNYLVNQVMETWPDWCSVMCTRQIAA